MKKADFKMQIEEFMELALSEALNSENDVPVGAIVVKDGEVIARAHNMKEKLKDISAHAEILALKQAAEILGDWRLSGCEIYVTLEPCPMCAWAILQSGIKILYFGSYNNQYGAMCSVLNLPELANSKIEIYGGIEEMLCDDIISEFFKTLREKKKSGL